MCALSSGELLLRLRGESAVAFRNFGVHPKLRADEPAARGRARPELCGPAGVDFQLVSCA
jgi:hypothetical protein